MSDFNKLKRIIKNNLNNNSHTLVSVLNEVATYDFNPNIDLLDFEVFWDPTRHDISISMYSMDYDANEVFNDSNQSNYFAGSKNIFDEISYCQEDLFDEEFWDEIDDDEYENLIIKIVTDWFTTCWKQSSMHSLTLPAYITFHDSYQSYDLKNKKWIDQDEKYV